MIAPQVSFPIDPHKLPQHVAQATGESLRTIRRFGFSLLSDDLAVARDLALCLACPGCGHEVRLSENGHDAMPPWAECSECDAAYPYCEDEVYAIDLV